MIDSKLILKYAIFGFFLISTYVNAQYVIDETVDDVPYYQHHAQVLEKIDSLKQDSNFVMTGFHKEPERAFKIWGPRLYPHGDFGVAASAYAEYYQNFNSATTFGCNEYDVEWDYVGCDGLPDFPFRLSAAGQINVLQFDPNYNNTTNKTIYGGSFNGGLWRTEDNGENWSQVNTDHQIPITSVSDIAIASDDSNTLFISTGGAGVGASFSTNYYATNPKYSSGIYRSTNYGENWEPINYGLTDLMNSTTSPGLIIRRMEINPTNSNQIFICTNKGIYRCNNSLSANPQWVKVGNSAGSTIDEDDIKFFGLNFKPGNSSVIYASGNDIVRSTNGGNDWHSIMNPSLDLNNMDFYFYNYNPNNLKKTTFS